MNNFHHKGEKGAQRKEKEVNLFVRLLRLCG
jgi:hypothetical protein